MNYIWDKSKASANLYKHHVSFDMAKQVFTDPHSLSWHDSRFAYFEQRWITFGAVDNMTIIVVAHRYEEEENDEETIRIISARRANKKERERYFQYKKRHKPRS
ncbi:MAG: BrnT family toxin [Gammaproteobacteria bacterium]|nr:BrnT family toxin [Gammaproteobacteria bacterium]